MPKEQPDGNVDIRVNFQVAKSVNPLLAQDLEKFRLGRSRHARLMALATVGLLTEKAMLNGGQQGSVEPGPQVVAGIDGAYKPRLSADELSDIG